MAVARVQEISDGGFQEKRNNLAEFFNFPPSISGGEDGFQIVEIPSSGKSKGENEIDLDGQRRLVKATSDLMKAAGYEAGEG